VIFETGDKVMAGLRQFACAHRITASEWSPFTSEVSIRCIAWRCLK
jgi:hypothetical protein